VEASVVQHRGVGASPDRRRRRPLRALEGSATPDCLHTNVTGLRAYRLEATRLGCEPLGFIVPA